VAVENFRSWIETWEKKGWLTRVRKPVEPRYTLGGITRKLGKEKAVLFEQVSGFFRERRWPLPWAWKKKI
jgi:3-polyprenyl-4-hydroxybenzoate decarboxylase